MPDDTVEVNVVVVEDDVFYQVASRLLVGIIRRGRLERPSENLLPICRQALERMSTMTLNEFVNKLDEPLWEQLIVADKRPGMAITMYALHDIWVDVLVQILDSDDWQVKRAEDLTKPPIGEGNNRYTDPKTTIRDGRSRIPKAPTRTTPISSTAPSPGSSPSKIPIRSTRRLSTSLKKSPESTPRPSTKASPRPAREPLPKVIPKPSLFKKRPRSPFSPYPRKKRSRSRDAQSSSKRRPRSAETMSSSKKRSPPTDPLRASGGVRERVRAPYGGTSAPGPQDRPGVPASKKRRRDSNGHAEPDGNVVVSSIPESSWPSKGNYEETGQAIAPKVTGTGSFVSKNTSLIQAQDETEGHKKKSYLRTSEAVQTEPVIPELRDRRRAPHSWKRGDSPPTKPSRQTQPDPTVKVPEVFSKRKRDEVKPKQPEERGRRTPDRNRHGVQQLPPFAIDSGEPISGTNPGWFTRGLEEETSEPVASSKFENNVAQVKQDSRSEVKRKQPYANPDLESRDNHEPLQSKLEEPPNADSQVAAGFTLESDYKSSRSDQDQPEHKPTKPQRNESPKHKHRRSKRNSDSRRGSQSTTTLRPTPALRSKSQWVSYYSRPTSPHQNPIRDNSELWAYFRSLLRINDEEIYSSTGPENPDFQPLPAPEPAPVGEPGPIVPYHELPERLQPKPVAGKGFVTPTTPFRVGFVTSILDPKVLRQRCLGRRGGDAKEEGMAGFNEGEYAARSKICYPEPLEGGSQSDGSGNGQPEGDAHRRPGQVSEEPKVGVECVEDVEDGMTESEQSEHGESETDGPEASNAAAGLSHGSMAKTEVSEPDSITANTSVYDYAGMQQDEVREPVLQEPISPIAFGNPRRVLSDEDMAETISAENHEIAKSGVDELPARTTEAQRTRSDYSDSDDSEAESSDPERYDAENLVIDEYGDEDEDDWYRPEDFEDEEYEVEREEAEDD